MKKIKWLGAVTLVLIATSWAQNKKEPGAASKVNTYSAEESSQIALAALTASNQKYTSVTGTAFKTPTPVRDITVDDKAYQITVIGIWKDLRRQAVGADYYRKANVGEQIITDTSSFILHLNGNEGSVSNIQNMFKDSIINRGKCKLTLLNEATATGIIQIDGIESITVVPADPPRQPGRGITIRFKKPTIVMPDVYMECKGATTTNRNLLAGMQIGFPQTISFMENELKDYWASKAGINEYQVLITPLPGN